MSPVTKKFPRIGSAVVVVNDEGAILLGTRAKEPNRGKWVLPGGKIEPFESIADAANREVREETGLTVEVTKQLGAFEIINPPDEHRLIVFSLAKPVSGELRAESDLGELRFWPRHEIPKLPLSDFVRDVLVALNLVTLPKRAIAA